MSSSDPLIHLADVKKVFYTDEVETHALSGIQLDIQKGEYVSIAGPSGCGKSTLLSILGAYINVPFPPIHPNYANNPATASRDRERRTTRRQSSTPFTPAIRHRTTTCESRTWPSTASTRAPRTPPLTSR